jgi:hypothetical protein
MTRILRPLRILVPTLLAALAAGCESSTQPPDEFRGTFVLETYAGHELPLPIFDAGGDTATHFLMADTMRLGWNGFGTQTRGIYVNFDDPAHRDVARVAVEIFRYRVDDGELGFTFRCPPGQPCPSGPYTITGWIEGDSFVLEFGYGPIRYRRIDD